jgi:hypothetical protein
VISLVAGATAQADPLWPSPGANALINLGVGTYAGASLIASGNPQAWYNSPEVAALYGGAPTVPQQQAFDQAVKQDIQTTFRLSGLSVSLTDDPSAAARHTISLVSGASSLAYPGAIGTTDVGADGFSFIDTTARSAQSVDQLQWIVAHNISHELMLAFGVGENYDQTGNYIDARNANFAMMINPDATFSAGAAQAIQQKLGPAGFNQVLEPWAQAIDPTAATPVPTVIDPTVATPEPSTVIVWGALIVAAAAARRARRPR